MNPSKTFNNVTQVQWNCVQETSSKEHGTVYTPLAPSNQGTTVTKVTFVGEIDTTYNYDPAAQAVIYTITKKPGIVPESSIWDGIEKTLKECAS